MSSRGVTVILLAGGRGKRMGTATPKQFLRVHGVSIARYSFDLFSSLADVREIIVVCSEEFRHLFFSEGRVSLQFAQPGKRRQDSVYNGFQLADPESQMICIHDAARPCVIKQRVHNVIEAARKHGAAALGVPVKNTIKELDDQGFVVRTPDRSHLWNIHTPQVVHADLLREGFAKAKRDHSIVSDDVSLIELISKPVKIVLDLPSNIKLTTPEDLAVVQDHLAPIESLAISVT